MEKGKGKKYKSVKSWSNIFMHNIQYAIRRRKYAFSLVELIIMAAILGILAAIVLPIFQGHITKAKEAAAKDTLRILRNAIELYAAQHNGVPPGYPDDDPTSTPMSAVFFEQMVRGNYLSKRPKNPFSGKIRIQVIGNAETFPTEPEIDTGGWIYQPVTKTIKLNWPGTDSEDITYFDY